MLRSIVKTCTEVLESFSAGPDTGIFTDGGASPNPGPGGWGFVHVESGQIIAEKSGSVELTTNNKMELTALIEAYKSLPEESEIDVFSDSQLCVNTINVWAASWEKRNWKRKTGPIANLELVKELYELQRTHPKVKLQWIKAHNGWLWNEYADALATAWMRAEV